MLALVAIAAVLVLASFGKRWVVTALVERGLAERGVRCSQIALDVAWDLSEVDVAQTTCRFGSGEREVEAGLPSGATIVLEGLHARSIRSPEITLALAGDPERELEDFGGALLDGEVPEPLERALDGLSRVAQHEQLPELHVEALRFRRGARTLDGYDFVLTPAEGSVTFSIARIAPPAIGERRLEVAAAIVSLEGQGAADRAQIRGQIQLSLELGPLGVTRSMGFTIDGEALGSTDARYTLSVDGGGELGDIRDRIAKLRTRRAERLEHRQERAEQLAERVHELAERLRGGTEEPSDAGAE
ncbi:MAG: hypothetical protein U0353_13615 [Sandaracinus sp.]